MREQSGTSQISHHSCLSLESGEGGPIYSLNHEGVQQGTTQGGTYPADPVVPFLASGSTELERYSKQLDEAKEKAEDQTTQKAKTAITATAQVDTPLSEPANTVVRMGTCECCGKDNIRETDLVRIDSGQLFCSDCLRVLKSISVS